MTKNNIKTKTNVIHKMPHYPIITEIKNKQHFADILEKNPSKLVMKLGAEWCGPCKRIEPLIHMWIEKLQDNIQFAVIDVDESFELYAFLKVKKMVNGIPAILCYNKGNLSHIPDDIVVGADTEQVNAFFNRCMK